MLLRKKIDSEKEIELIATLSDFLAETVEDASDDAPFDEREAEKALRKNKRTVDDLAAFRIEPYRRYIDKKLYSVCSDVKKSLKDQLYAWIQEDEKIVSGGWDMFEIKPLIKNARDAERKLKEAIELMRVEALKSYERYKSQHGVNDLYGEIEDYSARSKVKT